MPSVTAVSPLAVARAVALAVDRTPGVAERHDGAVGEVSTYGKAQRVGGVRVRDDETTAHVRVDVTVDDSRPVVETAEALRSATVRAVLTLRPDLTGVTVDINIRDIRFES